MNIPSFSTISTSQSEIFRHLIEFVHSVFLTVWNEWWKGDWNLPVQQEANNYGNNDRAKIYALIYMLIFVKLIQSDNTQVKEYKRE